MQEAFEMAVEQEETAVAQEVEQEVAQIGIGAYEGTDFSVVEQISEETTHRYYY